MTMTNMTSVRAAHQHVTFHRMAIEASTLCVCGHCHERYPPTAIHQWTDWLANVPTQERSNLNGQTAICPHCSIDAVLPDTVGLDLSTEFLTAFYKEWF